MNTAPQCLPPLGNWGTSCSISAQESAATPRQYTQVNQIHAEGRKGGSSVAAAILNALIMLDGRGVGDGKAGELGEMGV